MNRKKRKKRINVHTIIGECEREMAKCIESSHTTKKITERTKTITVFASRIQKKLDLRSNNFWALRIIYK